MKKKPKYVVVVPTHRRTGATAPAITTSVTYVNIDDLNNNDRKRAIDEAEQASRLSASDEYDFRIKEN
jgi:hypothetical protein